MPPERQPEERSLPAGSPGAAVARFGLVLSGTRVLLPAGVPVEFVARAAINPLPKSPPRVRGLTQLRGTPCVVLDAGELPRTMPVRCRKSVLIIERADGDTGV